MERKNTGLIVVIVILSLVIVGLGGFIVYDKVLNKDSKIETKVEDNNNDINTLIEENLELNDEIVLELYNMVTFPGDNILQNWYFYENEEVTLNTLDNNTKLWMAYTQMKDELIKEGKTTTEYIDNVNTKYFSINDFDDAMKKVFGENFNYEKEDFMPKNCDCNYKYDENNNQYICIVGGCGGLISKWIEKQLYKAVKNQNEIVLYEKFAYVDIDKLMYEDSSMYNEIPKESGIYKDVKEEILIKEFNTKEEIQNKIDISKYYDELSMVKYTFKKDSNNEYHFYSSEIIDEF